MAFRVVIAGAGVAALETALALITMLLMLLTRRRFAALVAFLIAAGGLGAVLLFAYVDVGGWGPLPNMYDPFWYPEKTVSAVAEAVAAYGGALAVGDAAGRFPVDG